MSARPLGQCFGRRRTRPPLVAGTGRSSVICTARRLRHGVLHLPQARLLDTAALSVRVHVKRYETVTAVTPAGPVAVSASTQRTRPPAPPRAASIAGLCALAGALAVGARP